ncbi:MAG TPA: hypothetical protein GXZ40_00025 [Bacteroidales bacterium]|nr:hypothetical protein [Bacteroidales bacterium]
MKKSSAKMVLVYLSVVILGLACFLKIVHLIFFQRSLFEGTSAQCLDKTQPDWESNPLADDTTCNCFVVQNDLKPLRGEIYDDRGRLLISNFNVFDITVDGRMLQPKSYRKGQHTIVNDTIYCGGGRNFSRSANPAEIEKLVNELAYAFYQQFKDRFPKKNINYYKKQFRKAIKEMKNAPILQSTLHREKEWITDEDTAFVNKLPLLSQKRKGGLNYTIRTVRINPYGDLARRTLGMYTDNKKFGLEMSQNEILQGEAGAQKYIYVNQARIPLNERIEPVDGFNIHTTLNLEIQNVVHNELLKILIEENAEWGCAVVMETKTGEVKAISNLTRTQEGHSVYEESQQNYALTAMVEPGSTFKLASLLAYLERTDNDSIKKYPMMYHTFIRKNKNGKEFRYPKTDGYERREEWGYPIEAFQRSSNVGIAAMIFDTYSIDNYQEYLKKIDSLFITTTFSTQLGMINAPNIKRKAYDFHSYYNACFGTGFKMTPIQTLIYFNAVANDGKMIVPLFVNAVTNKNDTIKKFEAEVIAEQIAKPETIKRARKYLEAVVSGERGTARAYKNKYISFAGKTGTRDIWDETTQSYLKNKNSASFCGYFPADEPKYTAIVFIYNVSRKSTIAVKAFANIAKNVTRLAYLTSLREIPTENKKVTPSSRAIANVDIPFVFQGYGVENQKLTKDSPYVRISYSDNELQQAKSSVLLEKNSPNMIGLTAADAVYELNKLGYVTKIYGRGRVKNQEYNTEKMTAKLYLE